MEQPVDVRSGRRWVTLAGAIVGVALVMLLLADRPLLGRGGASPSDGEEISWEEREIAIGVSCLRVQVADTPEKRSQGLRGRESLGEYDGMIFLYTFSSDQRAFTMSGVKFPLTIGFYDDAGTRVDAVDMEPCPDSESACPLYRSKGAFKTALEVAKGQLPEGAYMPTCLS